MQARVRQYFDARAAEEEAGGGSEVQVRGYTRAGPRGPVQVGGYSRAVSCG